MKEILKAVGAWDNIELHERDGSFILHFKDNGAGRTEIRVEYTVQGCGDGCCSSMAWTDDVYADTLGLSDDCQRLVRHLVAFDGQYDTTVMPAVWFDHPDLPPYKSGGW